MLNLNPIKSAHFDYFIIKIFLIRIKALEKCDLNHSYIKFESQMKFKHQSLGKVLKDEEGGCVFVKGVVGPTILPLYIFWG